MSALARAWMSVALVACALACRPTGDVARRPGEAPGSADRGGSMSRGGSDGDPDRALHPLELVVLANDCGTTDAAALVGCELARDDRAYSLVPALEALVSPAVASAAGDAPHDDDDGAPAPARQALVFAVPAVAVAATETTLLVATLAAGHYAVRTSLLALRGTDFALSPPALDWRSARALLRDAGLGPTARLLGSALEAYFARVAPDWELVSPRTHPELHVDRAAVVLREPAYATNGARADVASLEALSAFLRGEGLAPALDVSRALEVGALTTDVARFVRGDAEGLLVGVDLARGAVSIARPATVDASYGELSAWIEADGAVMALGLGAMLESVATLPPEVAERPAPVLPPLVVAPEPSEIPAAAGAQRALADALSKLAEEATRDALRRCGVLPDEEPGACDACTCQPGQPSWTVTPTEIVGASTGATHRVTASLRGSPHGGFFFVPAVVDIGEALRVEGAALELVVRDDTVCPGDGEEATLIFVDGREEVIALGHGASRSILLSADVLGALDPHVELVRLTATVDGRKHRKEHGCVPRVTRTATLYGRQTF